MIDHIKKNGKPLFASLKDYLKNYYIVLRYKQKFKNGYLSDHTREYRKYVDAVWNISDVKNKYLAFQKSYNKYFKPLEASGARATDKKHEQILFSLKSHRPLMVTPQGDFDKAVVQEVEKRVVQIIKEKGAKLQAEMQQKLAQEKQKLKALENTLIQSSQHQMAKEKSLLYQKILPFSSEPEQASDTNIFVNKDFHRMAALEQQKKQKQLEELEKELSYQQREQALDGKKIELYEQKVNLEHTTKQQELTARKIVLDAQAHRQSIIEQQLSLQAQQVEYAKNIMLLELQEKEIGMERKLVELTSLAANIQQEKRDVELQKKHIDLINLLADYEMKTREFDVLVISKVLDIRDEHLNLKSGEIDQRIRESEFNINQEKTRLEIEGKILGLQDRELSHKANAMLFQVNQERKEVENKAAMLDLKEEGVELLFREKNIKLDSAYTELAKKENDFTLSKMTMVQEKHELMNRLFLEQHKALNAQNQYNYLQASTKGNIWSSLSFLFANHNNEETL